MSDEKRKKIIEEIIELCQSGMDFDIAFKQARENHGLKK